ncbi:MAG: competence type IV pilus assembly protein ComGB [Paenisporosarcina sp.]
MAKRKIGIPKRLQSQFLFRLCNLLEEGYNFHTAILMLLPHHVISVPEVSNQIDRTLRNGNGVAEVFLVLGIPKEYLLPIDMAESHGRINVAILTLQKHMSMKERAEASLRKLMMYPLFLFIILACLFIAFRTYFLPNMKTLVASRHSANHDEMLNWTNGLQHLPDMLISLTAGCICMIVIFNKWLKRKPLDIQIKTLIKIPLLSQWLKLTWTRSFAQELGTLLASGLSLLIALDRLMSQTTQPFIQLMSSQIYDSIILGESIEKAVTITDCFLKEFPIFISHGEASGHLAKELLIYSELLTDRIETDVTKKLSLIQPILFGILAICILGAYLSILLPVYGMIDFI